MRKTTFAASAFLVVSLALTGCGSDVVEATSTSPTKPSNPEKSPQGSRDEDADTEDPEFVKRMEEAERGHFAWLRSDYVKNLDPRDLDQARSMANWGGDVVDTFEQAVDFGDLVVSGQVKDLLFIPDGTVTTFQVDRAAKGDPKSTVFILQATFVESSDGESRKTNNARLIYEQGLAMLFEGDRAVLVLRKIPELNRDQAEFLGDSLGGAPLYEIVRGHGQYLAEKDGKVQTEKTNTPVRDPDQSFNGKSEDELMDTAEEYAKDNRSSYPPH